MSSLNKVMLLGRLGKDPEIRKTQWGKTTCSFSLATSSKFGENEQTEWHRVIFWEKQAEIAAQYLKKASKVLVEGRIQSREYEKDGVKHKIYEIIGNTITFIDSKPKEATSESSAHGLEENLEDIPF